MSPRRRPAQPQLSKDARLLRMYRAQPATWARHKLNIHLARYRSRKQLEEWLANQDPAAHAWCRERLAQDRLQLDGRRSYQADALNAMSVPGRYAMQWCNGAAKTATAALMVLWFLDCYPGGRVVTTAGTWSQLREQLWREVATWAQRAHAPIAPNCAPSGIGKTQIDIAPDWAAFGRAADQGATFEGVHAPYVLVLMDEAKAIKAEIFDSVRRILRGNADAQFWWICLSSPGSPTGPFYDICGGEQAHRWTVMRLSAYETERVDLELLAADAHDIGEASPLFVSMNLGEFPDETDDTVIPLSHVQAALGRVVNCQARAVLGVDVARMGSDETSMVEFQGGQCAVVQHYQGKRTTETAGIVMQMRGRYGEIGIDDGGVGGGVVDMLLEAGVNVTPLAFGGKPSDARFFDLGTQMMFSLARELELGAENPSDPDVGVSLPNDKVLLHQLTARRYEVRRNGQLKLEAKAEMKKRGERSPDRADAAVMAHWMRGQQVAGNSLADNLQDQETTFGRLELA